ncbi:MAG: efflux RND transporter periplasmic adaptor subunit [Verrucomicrobiales bacterium]|nr:efflux RND transporter periplasmic adaptor subunit [Verrucomicrobiales bacterium]
MDERSDRVGKWWKVVRGLLLLVLLLGLVYRAKFSPLLVAGHRLERGEIVAEVMGTGTLEARVKSTISARISGLLSNVLVDQGDRVEKGDLLVELDDAVLLQQVEIAKADIAAKEASIVRLVTDKNRAVAVLKQATRLLERMQKAIESGSVSQTDLDKSNEMFAIAQAGLGRAEAAITEGQKALVTAEETLRYHRVALDNTKVTAPFDGLVVRRQRDPGDIVLPGSAILTLVSTEELWVSAWVDETEMNQVKPGQEARVIFRSVAEQPFRGKVARLGRETDRETREFVVDVSVVKKPVNWAVGQRAEVYIEAGRKASVLLLPANYLQWRKGLAGVFTATDGRAVWNLVKLGLRNDDFYEVVEGVKEGDDLIIPSKLKQRLEGGQRIKVK